MKAAVPPPDQADRAFRMWLRTLAEGLTIDPEGALASQDALAFLWSAFAENGAMPPAYFAPLLGAHRQAHAQQAVTALLTQVHAETGRRLDVPVRYSPPTAREPEGAVRVGPEVVQGIDPSDIHAEAAEGVQCLLADRDRLVWPLCPDHRVGLHATRAVSGAVWVCSVDDHTVRRIV
ncbi:hypothetical protein [Streptomyces arboris]|uniref:Uncharacterized protein n=1 Tax=Streptomyces arboris TaxID=2600619 RepID=A0A5N5EVA9_9ACTN|nr:hypothetical protein [Streptomyces arboris]KAB2592720.1 hypothetical protein F5983_09180 [Streptomyces arboris]